MLLKVKIRDIIYNSKTTSKASTAYLILNEYRGKTIEYIYFFFTWKFMTKVLIHFITVYLDFSTVMFLQM